MSGDRGFAGRAVRGLLLAVGVGGVGVGLLVVVVPEARELVPVEAAVRALGSDYVLVALVGVLAVGLSAFVVVARHVRGVTETNPPVVEGVQSAAYPGSEFDRTVEDRLGFWGDGSSRAECRDRLEEAAVRATMDENGCSRAAAERLVAAGDWTDDDVAGQYLARTDGDDWDTMRDGRAVRRTVEAIAGTADDGTDPGQAGERTEAVR